MKYLYISLLLLFSLLKVSAQNGHIEGHIYGLENEPLNAAIVYFTQIDQYIITDENGFFKLDMNSFLPGSIITSHIGYKSDTTYIKETGHYDITLQQDNTISTIQIKGRRVGTSISSAVAKIEMIDQIELTKSACCDLAGCFNTQGSVQVNTTNIITNSKELRLLGVSGVYNQILVEGLPLAIGNSLTYGVSQLTGTMINTIMVAKGTSSILQGYDAIAGQINVIFKKYDQIEPLFFNAYINNFGEKQMNLNLKTEVGRFKVSNGLHYVLPGRRMDIEGDGFMNMPLINRIGVYQTWETGNTDEVGYSSVTGIYYTSESRVGGQFDYDPFKDAGSDKVYGHNVNIRQPSIWTKHYYRWSGRQGVGFYSSYQHHDQSSWFGLLRYKSQMNNMWANMQYETIYGNHNLFKAGLSYRFFESDEEIHFAEAETYRTYGGRYLRIERVPGVYAENTLVLAEEKVSLITGARFDRHNQFGNFFTPRAMVKYDVTPFLVYRASAGKGYRTLNLFADYPQIMASNRQLIIGSDIRPEIAYNFGSSLNYKLDLRTWVLDFGIDAYYTHFENQLFPDFDSEPSTVSISNLENASEAFSLQGDVKVTYDEWLEFKVIYNYLDVNQQIEGQKVELPFIQQHRLTSTVSIRPKNMPFFLDFNIHNNGRMRLPDPSNLPEQYQYDPYSKPYTILNAQATWNFKSIALYAGCENITGFYQAFPIRSYDDPFGQFFDITTVWGPTRGREWYMGIRYTVE